MNPESLTEALRARRTRVDRSFEKSEAPRGAWLAALAACAIGFACWGAFLERPSETESRLGLAGWSTLGPVAHVFGGWDPRLLPGQVTPHRILAMFTNRESSPFLLHLPAMLAAVALGLIVVRRLAIVAGRRVALLGALCLFGSPAFIDRSANLGLDFVSALAIVAALDRILSKGSDWLAGALASVAFLCGGWPALAVILVPVVVLGRAGSTLSARLVTPPILAFLAWAIWTVESARTEVLAAALSWPLTQKPAWRFALSLIVLGLPWTPFAVLLGFRSARANWPGPARSMWTAWLGIAGVCAVVGTLIPGVATAAKVPAVVGLAIASAFGLERLLASTISTPARRYGFAAILLLAGVTWLAVLPVATYLALAIPYYRIALAVLIILTMAAAWCAAAAVWKGCMRRGIVALVLVACAFKTAHAGFYLPEWSYRFGQGPWGRAIGQYVPPRWPIFVFVAWPPELAYSSGHLFKQISHGRFLKYYGEGPHYVLLQQSEFDHWPESAPKLLKVRSFQDQRGRTRVLARTEGDLRRVVPELSVD